MEGVTVGRVLTEMVIDLQTQRDILLDAARFALEGVRQLGSDWGDECEAKLEAAIKQAESLTPSPR